MAAATANKKTRVSKYQWVRDSHCDEILPSWGMDRCLAYLALSECTQLKLPGCKSPGTITVTQAKELVYQKLLNLLNCNCIDAKEQQSEALDLTALVYTLNLQQCLTDIALPELKLPCLTVSNGDKWSVLKDVERVHQNSLRVVDFMNRGAASPLILFSSS
jgi:hypothetical protein